MKSFSQLAQSVEYTTKGSKIVLNDQDPELRLIGEGRSAFAFKVGSTNKVLKVFFPSFTHVAKEEAEIYKRLSSIDFYPTLYESGPNYLVIDYIEGNTLFNCLVKGIPVTTKHIRQIDFALVKAKANGLNPSDIHLRNIFITTEGEIKIIDVARFRQTKSCSQWDDLKIAFYKFYNHQLFPKKLPESFLNGLAHLYKKNCFQKLL